MIKRLFLLIAPMIVLTLISGVTLAAVPFYEGKVIRIIAGKSPGSGFDIYSRVVARHMGKHIPGNPASPNQLFTWSTFGAILFAIAIGFAVGKRTNA